MENNKDLYSEIKSEVIGDLEKSLKENKKQYRTRNYACVVYPESAPCEWENILIEHKIPCFISPYHDNDFNPDGEPKKPHYHIIIMFDSVKTENQAREIFNTIGGVGCEVVKSIRGYARYLCHLDNPEKAQYNPDGVRSLNGADFYETISLVGDRYFTLKEIISFCECNSIYSYRKLVSICNTSKPEWFRVVCDSTVFLLGYLKSFKFDLDNEVKGVADNLPDNVKNQILFEDMKVEEVKPLPNSE